MNKQTLFTQRFLSSASLYNGKLDGIKGPLTHAAEQQFKRQANNIQILFGIFDKRSEANISTLLPKAQIAARQMLKAALAFNLNAQIISGTRTYEEQNALYRKGRYGNKEPKVTNARAGQSYHNFGLAWDIGLFTSGNKYLTIDILYKELAANLLSSLPNIEWGGHWKTFKDYPHYQLKTQHTNIATIKTRFETGKPYT